MLPNEYQEWTKTTFKLEPGTNIAWVYLAMGLAGEAGEVSNVLKKIIRDEGMVPKVQTLWKAHDELGDVLWYVARLADELGITLSQLMEQNKKKLEERYK